MIEGVEFFTGRTDVGRGFGCAGERQYCVEGDGGLEDSGNEEEEIGVRAIC